MINIGRKADAGGVFKILIRTMIAAVLEGREKKLANVAINSLKHPAVAQRDPVAANPQRNAAIVKAVFHRSGQQAVRRIFGEPALNGGKLVVKTFGVLAVVVRQMVNSGAGINRIQVDFIRL